MIALPSLLKHEVPQQWTLNSAPKTGLRHLSLHHLVETDWSQLRYLLKVVDHHLFSSLPSSPQLKCAQGMPFFLDDKCCGSKEMQAACALRQVPGKSNTAHVTIGKRTTLGVETEVQPYSEVKQKLAGVNFSSWQRFPPGPGQLVPHASSKAVRVFLQVTDRNQVWLLRASYAWDRYIIRRVVRV